MDASNVVTALSGAVYVAPVGSAAPTAATQPLGKAWKSLGYLSSDGVTENDFADTSDITAWQGSGVVRRAVVKRGTTYSFYALETNRTVAELFYGFDPGDGLPPLTWDDTYTANYEAAYGSVVAPVRQSPSDTYTWLYESHYGAGGTPRPPGSHSHTIGDSREHPLSMVIDIVDRSTVIRRYIPNGVIAERGEVRFSATDVTAYPFSVSALPDPTIGGTVLCLFNRVIGD